MEQLPFEDLAIEVRRHKFGPELTRIVGYGETADSFFLILRGLSASKSARVAIDALVASNDPSGPPALQRYIESGAERNDSGTRHDFIPAHDYPNVTGFTAYIPNDYPNSPMQVNGNPVSPLQPVHPQAHSEWVEKRAPTVSTIQPADAQPISDLAFAPGSSYL